MRRANDRPFTRRTALFGAAASGLVLATSRAMAQTSEALAAPAVRSNISGFRVASWQDHFDDLRNGAILCDIDSRAVQFWSEDENIYKLYPSSVPLTEELTRRGYTTRKIGRQSSNGCIGLYNEHIEELFGLAEVGTQVKLF